MIPTPGQIAYEAYVAIMVPLAPWGTPDFAQLPEIHRAWDAAAEAAITAWIASPDFPMPAHPTQEDDHA